MGAKEATTITNATIPSLHAKPKGSTLLKIEELPGRKAASLEDLNLLSGGDINAIIVWRKDGNVDFYAPEGKKIKPGRRNPSEIALPRIISPKKSMKDHDLATADIVLINGTPKLASINGTLYEVEDDPLFEKIGSPVQN